MLSHAPRSWLAAVLVLPLLALPGCGGGDEDDSSYSSSSSSASSSASSAACGASYPDSIGYNSKRSKNAGNAQCTTMLDAMESYRQAAIANCQAGNTSAASANYSYYNQYKPLLSSVCN